MGLVLLEVALRAPLGSAGTGRIGSAFGAGPIEDLGRRIHIPKGPCTQIVYTHGPVG